MNRIYFAILLFIACGHLSIFAPVTAVAEEDREQRRQTVHAEVERLFGFGIFTEGARQLERHLRDDPGDLRGRRLLAQAYHEMGAYAELAQQARLILEERPGDERAQAWLEEAQTELEAMFPESLAELRAALESDPEDDALRLRLIEFLTDYEEIDAAAEQYEILLRRNPENAGFHLRYARFLAIHGRNEEAQLYYRNYLEMQPDDRILQEMFDVLLRRAQGLLEEDRLEDAEAVFRGMIEQYPDDRMLRLQYARFLAQADEYDRSVRIYENLLGELDPVRDEELYSQVRFELASALAWSGRGGAAASRLRALIQEEPDNLEAMVLLGDVHRWFDDTDAAREFYRQVLDRDPEHPGALRGIRELEEMIELRRAQAERLSIPAMEERLRADPGDQEARLQLTRLYTAVSRYEDANRLFAEYLRRDPDSPTVRRAYAFSLSMIEEYDAAIVQLRRYLEDFPDDVESRLRIVNMMMWQGDFTAAERELLDMLPDHPENTEIHWNLGRIYQMREDWEPALFHLGEVVRLSPTFRQSPHYQAAQARIAQIHAHPRYRLLRLQLEVDEDPSRIDAHLELARLFLNLERYAEARASAGAVVRVRRGDAEAEEIIRRADEGLIRFRAEQIRGLRAALEEDPDDITTMLELARILAAEGRAPEAQRLFQRYLQLSPDDLEVRWEHAQILRQIPDRQSDALREFQRYRELAPESRLNDIRYLEILTEVDELDAEGERLRRALEEDLNAELGFDPLNRRALYLRARLRQAVEQWIAAREDFETLVDLDPDYEDAAERLRNLLEDNRYRIAVLEQRVRLHPSRLEPRLELARLLFDVGLYFRAMEVAREIIHLEPRTGEARRLLREAEERVTVVREERMRALRMHLLEEPRDLRSHLELARLFKEDEQVDEAIRHFRIYLRARPNDIQARRDYAEMLSWYADHIDEAVSEFRQLAEFYPENIEVRKQYAQVMVWSRPHWRLAEIELLDLMVDAPSDLDIQVMLADLYRFQGRYLESRELYERVLRYEPLEQRPVERSRLRPGNRRLAEVRDADRLPPLGRERPREARVVAPRSDVVQPVGARMGDSVPVLERERTIVLPEFEGDFEQARAGLRALDEQLRPQLAGQISYLEDNEDYAEFGLGLRYLHFLRSGVQVYLDLSRIEYTERGADVDEVIASILGVGMASRFGDRASGSAELFWTNYDSGQGSSLSGNLRGAYEFTPVYTWALEYSKFDVIRDVKTVSSLVEGIDADRIAVSVTSNPPPRIGDVEFMDRVFVDAQVSYAHFSDNNRQTAFAVRPYYRVMDVPVLDVVLGWRGLDYAQDSPFYWSPRSYQGPLFGARLAGEMLWDITYDIRFESFFPQRFGGPARSFSVGAQRTFLENFFGGFSLFASESPREDDFRYRFWGLVLDLTHRF